MPRILSTFSPPEGERPNAWRETGRRPPFQSGLLWFRKLSETLFIRGTIPSGPNQKSSSARGIASAAPLRVTAREAALAARFRAADGDPVSRKAARKYPR